MVWRLESQRRLVLRSGSDKSTTTLKGRKMWISRTRKLDKTRQVNQRIGLDYIEKDQQNHQGINIGEDYFHMWENLPITPNMDFAKVTYFRRFMLLVVHSQWARTDWPNKLEKALRGSKRKSGQPRSKKRWQKEWAEDEKSELTLSAFP